MPTVAKDIVQAAKLLGCPAPHNEAGVKKAYAKALQQLQLVSNFGTQSRNAKSQKSIELRNAYQILIDHARKGCCCPVQAAATSGATSKPAPKKSSRRPAATKTKTSGGPKSPPKKTPKPKGPPPWVSQARPAQPWQATSSTPVSQPTFQPYASSGRFPQPPSPTTMQKIIMGAAVGGFCLLLIIIFQFIFSPDTESPPPTFTVPVEFSFVPAEKTTAFVEPPLDPKPTAPIVLQSQYGLLNVQTFPWSQVLLDDVFLANAPFNEAVQVPSGDHTLTFKFYDGKIVKLQITVHCESICEVKYNGQSQHLAIN